MEKGKNHRVHGVSASAEDLQKLSEASSAIQTGINDLSAGAEELQSQISFEAYKAVMLKNGLNIEELQKGNANAVTQIENQCH